MSSLPTDNRVSPNARVSNTGCMTGCIRPVTSAADRTSPQLSSGVWSGRIRSACSVVSSGNDEKLTTNGTFASASTKPAVRGRLKAGLVCASMSSGTRPAAMSSTRDSNPAYELGWRLAIPSKRTVRPTLPAT